MASTKRLNINLPTEAYDDLRHLAADSGRSMTEVVRTSLGLARLAYDEGKNDRMLAVTSKDGRLVKQVVIL